MNLPNDVINEAEAEEIVAILITILCNNDRASMTVNEVREAMGLKAINEGESK